MDKSNNVPLSRVPWSKEPSLKQMTEEVGVDFDRFIADLKEQKTDLEMAEEFAVTEKLISHLRERFYTHGLDSVEGQD